MKSKAMLKDDRSELIRLLENGLLHVSSETRSQEIRLELLRRELIDSGFLKATNDGLAITSEGRMLLLHLRDEEARERWWRKSLPVITGISGWLIGLVTYGLQRLCELLVDRFFF
jgi:hypothetical protein